MFALPVVSPLQQLALWLLLSSVALVSVRGQSATCSVVLGDVSAADNTNGALNLSPSPFLFPVATAASLPNSQSKQSINTLAINGRCYNGGSCNILLGLYDGSDNRLAIAQVAPSGGSNAVYTAPLTDPTTGAATAVTLHAGTTYQLAVLSYDYITLLYRAGAGLAGYAGDYSSGLQPSYSGATLQYAVTGALGGLSCTADGSGGGDPLFTGFRGQLFYIAGVDGQVMNVLSTHNLQLNGRLVQLVDGQSITPHEQDKLREWSEEQHKADPTAMPAPYPRTTAWTHDGTYFSDAGVALLDASRLYVKAGGYAEGWAVVTLNGRPLPVSDQSVVLGQGVNTTHIQRMSAHTLVIRTVSVTITLVNSDHFLNVERVHLESGYERFEHAMGGILGGTVDASWSWNPDVEAANTVQSGDLFERQVVEM